MEGRFAPVNCVRRSKASFAEEYDRVVAFAGDIRYLHLLAKSFARQNGPEALMAKPTDRPLVLILVAAFVSFVFSVCLWFFVDKDSGVFVGIWVPSILALGALLRRST